MKKDFNVIIEKDEDGNYVATVPALKGCHTQAKSLDVLMERAKEAIELCLEVESEQIYPVDFVGVQKVTVNEKTNYYVGSKTGKTAAKKGTYKALKGILAAKKLKSKGSQHRIK
jgi:predicted RNase H-like HicB family nuclease